MNPEIREYIQLHTAPQSLQKGKNLYKRGSVLSLSHNPEIHTYSAKVKGSRMYVVTVGFDDNNFPDTSLCNCPYDWGGLCKHEVATLLAIADQPAANDSLTTTSITKKAKPLLPNDKTLTKALLEKLIRPDIRKRRLPLPWIVKVTNFEGPDSMEISLSYNSYWEQNHETVKLNREEKGISVNCTCNYGQSHFCKHVAAFLYHFLENTKVPDILRLLDRDFYYDQISKSLSLYGLPNLKNPEKALKITASEGRLVYSLSKKYQGLIPVAGDQGKEFSNLFNNNVLAAKTDQFLLDKLIDDTSSTHNRGFGIVFSFEYNYDIAGLSTKAITGKLNKKGNKLISSIAPVELKSLPYLENHQQEVLKLLIELEKAIDTLSTNSEEEMLKGYAAILPLLKRLFNTLSLEHFTYLREYVNPYYLDKISKNSLSAVSLSNTPVTLAFELATSEQFIELTPTLVIGDDKAPLHQGNREDAPIMDLMFHHNGTLHLIDNVEVIPAIQFFRANEKLITTKSKQTEFIQNFVLPLTKNFDIDMSKAKGIEVHETKPATSKRQLYFSEMADFIILTPTVEYEGGHLQNILEKGTPWIAGDKGHLIINRDETFESSLYDLIKALHPKLDKQFPIQFFHMKVEDMLENWWFLEAFEKLQQENIEVFGLDKLKKFKYNPYPAKVSTSISSGIDWFEVEMQIAFGDISVSLMEVKKAVVKKEKFVKLSDGSFGVLPKEWLEKFERMFRQGDVKDDTLKISSKKFMIIDSLFDKIDNQEVRQQLDEKKKKLSGFSSIKKVKIPKGVNATLRDYQREGLNWINFLNEYGWGGILADDMGLGKTLQVLSFLMLQKRKSTRANLIVVPTTLIFNWENEINKFCPSLKTYFHYGSERNKDSKIFKKYDTVITTYGTMVNDIELLKGYTFSYIILDESQAIKNTQSLRFKAARLLKGRNKLALTGTPIENNTFDLYAQMQFVNPGLFGSAKAFKDQFSQPIDKDNNVQIATELRNMVLPFMIRRTKEQVATELPPKTEELLYCTMDTKQRQVYDAFRNRYRDYLMGKIEEEGLEKSKIYVLEGLTKLRQICDSPAILNDQEDYGDDSVKIKELIRNIREKTGQHKIIVFSQFVKMLKLIETRLQEEGIAYEYLDGQSTKKARESSVQHFQEDEKCRVFLISLKAGGTGLNLTAADYVFLVDPWWNPAVENQAIDRCYRIGQDKKVFAYRMICQNTVEEKILMYQQKKQAVADEIIQAEGNIMKNLTFDDIKGLFE